MLWLYVHEVRTRTKYDYLWEKRKELKIRPTFLPQFQIQCYNSAQKTYNKTYTHTQTLTERGVQLHWYKLWYFSFQWLVYKLYVSCCYDVDERYFFFFFVYKKMTNLSCVYNVNTLNGGVCMCVCFIQSSRTDIRQKEAISLFCNNNKKNNICSDDNDSKM